MNPSETKTVGTRLMRYLKDPTVALWRKFAGLGAALYVVWPLDVIPDVPVVGWLDDIGVLGLGVMWMMRELKRHSRKDEVVEGAFRKV